MYKSGLILTDHVVPFGNLGQTNQHILPLFFILNLWILAIQGDQIYMTVPDVFSRYGCFAFVTLPVRVPVEGFQREHISAASLIFTPYSKEKMVYKC